MGAVSIHSNFKAQENKVSHCFHCFPIYLPRRDGIRCHNLSFLNVEFKPSFSLSSFIKRLFVSCSLSAIREKKKVHSFFNQSKFLSDFKEIIAWNKIVVLNYRGSGSEMCTPDLMAQHTKSKKKKVRNFPYSDFKHPLF